ncbi:MAG: RIP metalloprotease RseP [Treponema sp.]|nr:RIP metalloprotease RseP [Treponema sp.]
MLIISRILLGLLGLGIVVFVHELGHFIGARLMGIGVEAFSIGWGMPIFKKKIRGVEYRLGLFPLGGYCKMKGDNDYEGVYNRSLEGKDADQESFLGVSPFKRIVACLGGPLFNLVFAVLVLTVIWGLGFEVNTLSNRIVLVSEINPEALHPADEAGLQTGDRIISIMGRQTETFHDIQEIIAVNADREMPVMIEREGQVQEKTVRPLMDRSTGAGRIGIYFWTDPYIERVVHGSPADLAGLQGGDLILSINGTELPHTMALMQILQEEPARLDLEINRGGQLTEAQLIPVYIDGAVELGIHWQAVRYQNPRLALPAAIQKGAEETWKTFIVSVRSLGLLFKGIDLTQAVSGPVRITYMVGDVATAGFMAGGFFEGLSTMANFLSLISIALCIMNLLPLPVLDGGMILMFLVEGIRRRPLHPRLVSAFQTLGVVLIIGLMLFAIFGDILFLARR